MPAAVHCQEHAAGWGCWMRPADTLLLSPHGIVQRRHNPGKQAKSRSSVAFPIWGWSLPLAWSSLGTSQASSTTPARGFWAAECLMQSGPPWFCTLHALVGRMVQEVWIQPCHPGWSSAATPGHWQPNQSPLWCCYGRKVTSLTALEQCQPFE